MASPAQEGSDERLRLKKLDEAVEWLRSKLGNLFFEGASGSPAADVAFTNLLRLRALWEIEGESPPNLIDGVQDKMYATEDDRLVEAAENLFGVPSSGGKVANVGPLPRGKIGTGDGRSDAGDAVSMMVRRMESEIERSGASPWELQSGQAPLTPGDTPDSRADDKLSSQAGVARGGGGASSSADDKLASQAGVATGGTGGGGSTAGGGGSAAGGAGGDTFSGGALQGTPSSERQVPGGGELWQVGGRHYLAYKVPDTNVPLVWEVEDDERLETIFGTSPPKVDRTLTEAEFKGMSPWQIGGLSSELAVTAEDPWRMFLNEFDKAAELRPWLNDPSMMATIAVAYLEGREPTRDELALTDWWNEHTADERAWLERSATAGDAEVRRMHGDARTATAEALREAGMDNAHDNIIDYIATQRLTGAWSEAEANTQIRKLVDPYAPGKLDNGLLAALRDPAWVTGGDAKAISQGRDAVLERLTDMFESRNVVPGHSGETSEQALGRLADAVMSGERTIDDIRRSADFQADKQAQGRPGGLDITQEGEEEVRQLASRWLGPEIGRMSEDQVAQWAGRIRNNPDAQNELLDTLRQQRLAMLPGYTNENLTYEDIVQPVRNLAANVWGEPITDEALLVDLANTMDYSEMSKRLRRTGLEQGKTKPTQDALSGLMGTSAGNRVQRSSI